MKFYCLLWSISSMFSPGGSTVKASRKGGRKGYAGSPRTPRKSLKINFRGINPRSSGS
ncbi:hypothetical protein PR003_g21430 [Phytophthora rubi]|uniref:Uncharacterized protein n=1 Tax=Phytophthora rubi TaxID=129364 RepID=A0A6A4DGU4_9STRA|nr:hypothetical protein PR002_g21077 [Phytophthora rubi]KAE8993788.1 hypothetical protein PR001_g20577 [Phytophthora rubi]KAE9305681.1 hypothetical protein PR003_g21430 [Phytophthora rubi]